VAVAECVARMCCQSVRSMSEGVPECIARVPD